MAKYSRDKTRIEQHGHGAPYSKYNAIEEIEKANSLEQLKKKLKVLEAGLLDAKSNNKPIGRIKKSIRSVNRIILKYYSSAKADYVSNSFSYLKPNDRIERLKRIEGIRIILRSKIVMSMRYEYENELEKYKLEEENYIKSLS